MKTICIQIGNSDDKLTQAQWAEFVRLVKLHVTRYCRELHFSGASANWEPWQNASWVFTCDDNAVDDFKVVLTALRKEFKQNSIAWLEGETRFI